MISLLSLSQLDHKARCEDNVLALTILDRLDSAVESAVTEATQKNDADYSYEIWDAVQSIQLLMDAEWYKVDETRHTKDQIIYMVKGLHEDTSPYNNQIKLFKYKGFDCWRLIVNGGQYGEQIEEHKFTAGGYKEAQTKATKLIIDAIKKGLELSF